MTGLWVVAYVVTNTCYIFTVSGALFTDAATVQDGITDTLRRGGVRPDTLTVTGPYDRVIADCLPVRIGVQHEPPILPSGVVVREATSQEQFTAILRACQRAVHEQTATHDCGEWVHGCLCGVCCRWLGEDAVLDEHDLREPPRRQH